MKRHHPAVLGTQTLRDDAKRTAAQRGATLVEYALVASLVLVGLLVVFDQLSGAASNEVDNQAMCISDRPPPTASADECAFAPPPPDVSVPDPAIVPPTTAPPNPNPDTFALSTGSSTSTPDSGWTISLPVELTRSVWQDPPGDPVAEPGRIVTARVRFKDPANPSQFLPGEQFTDCTTNAAGECTLEFVVVFPDVVEVTMLVTGVNTPTPPANVPSSLATFTRPVGP